MISKKNIRHIDSVPTKEQRLLILEATKACKAEIKFSSVSGSYDLWVLWIDEEKESLFIKMSKTVLKKPMAGGC